MMEDNLSANGTESFKRASGKKVATESDRKKSDESVKSISKDDSKQNPKQMLLEIGYEFDKLVEKLNIAIENIPSKKTDDSSSNSRDSQVIDDLVANLETKMKKTSDRFSVLKNKFIETNTPQNLKLRLPEKVKMEKIIQSSHKNGITMNSLEWIEEFGFLLSVGKDGSASLWNGSDLNLVETKVLYTSEIDSVIYSPAAKSIIIGTSDQEITLFGINSKGFTEKVKGLKSYGVKALLSIDSRNYLASISSTEQDLKVWDLNRLSLVASFGIEELEKNLSGTIVSKFFYDAEKNCLIIGFDHIGTIKVYDLDNFELLTKLNYGKRIYQMQYLSNRKILLFRGDNGIVIRKFKNNKFEEYAQIPLKGSGFYAMLCCEEAGWVAVDEGSDILFYTLDGKMQVTHQSFSKSVVCLVKAPAVKKIFVGDYFFSPIYVFKFE